MANLVARLLEKRIAHLFENFEAGKNVTSSLLKGEGTAKDLQFNRNFINNLLPRTFCTTNATCKLLKWQVSLRTLGKAPVTLVISGINITIQQLPPGQARPPKAKAKPKKRGGKKAEGKRNAILQGIKVQLSECSFRVQLLPPPGSVGPAAQEAPFLLISLSSFRIHSTNSQWQEVGELSKVHVINTSSDEALSFKKIEVVGCTLIVLDTSPIPFSNSPPKACMVFDDVRVLGKVSTKRRCTDWEALAFKVDIELPEVKIALSRRELYMIRNFGRALAGGLSAKSANSSHQRNASLGTLPINSDPAEEEEEDWDGEDVVEADADSLDSILEAQGSSAWTDSETRWCSHIDNSLHFYLKQVDVQAKEDEDAADSPSFLIVAANLQAKLWPAQNTLIKTVTGRPEHIAELSARSVTIEEIESRSQKVSKLPQHRVFLRPSGAMDASEPQPLFFASVQFIPVPKSGTVAAAAGVMPTPPAIKVRLGSLNLVVDTLVWMRFLRCFKGSSIDKAMRTKDKEKKKTHKHGGSKSEMQPAFNIEADAISIVSPVYSDATPSGATPGSFRAVTKVSEMIFNIGAVSVHKKPASRYEWMLGGGLFVPSATAFPCAQGDYGPASVAFSRQSACDALRGELESISLSFANDVNEPRTEVVSVQFFRFGVATNRRWENSSPPLDFPKEEVWIEFEGGPAVLWGMRETAHLIAVYQAYFYGPQAQAIRDEEDQARHMIEALEAARTGASEFSREGKDAGGKHEGGLDRMLMEGGEERELSRVIGLRMNGVKVRVYTTAEDTAANGAGGGGAEQRPGSLPQKAGSSPPGAAGGGRAGSDGAEAVILSRMLDVMVEMTRYNGGRERGVSVRGKSFGFFFAVDDARTEEVGERGDEELLAFRIARRKGGGADANGKALSANLVVVQLQRVTIKVDLQRVQELKRAVVSTKKAMAKDALIKREKERGPGAAIRKGAANVGKTLLAGFHALVELSGCTVGVSALTAHSSWPVTLSNQGLVLHNRAERGGAAWGGFGSPLAVGVRGRQGDDRNGIPGVEELARARESQQLVLAELEALETKFAVGPLRTVEAAVESTPGDHIHELTRMQMGDYLSELQAARQRIAAALFHSAAQPPTPDPEPKRRQDETTLSDVQKSVAYTRLCLEELKSVMEEDRADDDDEAAKRGFDFQVSEDCKLSLGIDGHEMVEMFEAFCNGPYLQNEYDLLFGED